MTGSIGTVVFYVLKFIVYGGLICLAWVLGGKWRAVSDKKKAEKEAAENAKSAEDNDEKKAEAEEKDSKESDK